MKLFLTGVAALGLAAFLLFPRKKPEPGVSHFSSFAIKPEKKKSELRKPSAVKSPPQAAESAEAKAKYFLKSKTAQEWSVEKDHDRVVSLYGGTVKELVNSDAKLKSFVADLVAAMGFDSVEFAEAKDLQKKSDLEVINEFHQSAGGIEVYGAYFRTFRDADNLNGSYFINEFKKYDQVNSAEAFTLEDIKSKIDQYYGRLGLSVSETDCKDKVYFVNPEQVAELSYKCVVKAQTQVAAPLPQVYEVVVSLSNSDVLFQKKITILN